MFASSITKTARNQIWWNNTTLQPVATKPSGNVSFCTRVVFLWKMTSHHKLRALWTFLRLKQWSTRRFPRCVNASDGGRHWKLSQNRFSRSCCVFARLYWVQQLRFNLELFWALRCILSSVCVCVCVLWLDRLWGVSRLQSVCPCVGHWDVLWVQFVFAVCWFLKYIVSHSLYCDLEVCCSLSLCAVGLFTCVSVVCPSVDACVLVCVLRLWRFGVEVLWPTKQNRKRSGVVDAGVPRKSQKCALMFHLSPAIWQSQPRNVNQKLSNVRSSVGLWFPFKHL